MMIKINKEHSVKENESKKKSPGEIAPGEIVIGFVVSVDASCVYVDYVGNPHEKSLLAISTVLIDKKHIGRDVALLFNNGDFQQPVVMGIVYSALAEAIDKSMSEEIEVASSIEKNKKLTLSVGDDLSVVHDSSVTIVREGGQCRIESDDELVLKCGKASITLRKDGQLLLRGTHLSSRSTGVNRILGGSVLLN